MGQIGKEISEGYDDTNDDNGDQAITTFQTKHFREPLISEKPDFCISSYKEFTSIYTLVLRDMSYVCSVVADYLPALMLAGHVYNASIIFL